MPYKIAGIDVHKKKLAVVVSDVEVEGEYQFERRQFRSSPDHLRLLAEWLIEQQVEEVVMESTAQYWKPVWEALERYWKAICQKRHVEDPISGALHLAQAQSNRGPRGRKKDFPDAERLVKRLVADELTLSFAPEPEQRLWRTVTRRKFQLRRNRVQFQNRLECLLGEAHIKLSSLVSDLLGASARRMLKALAGVETNPAALAALADQCLRARQLCDALGACAELNPVYRRLLKMALEELQFIEQQIPRSKSLPKSVPRQHRLLRRRNSLLGLEHVREMKRVRECRTAIAPRRAVAICAAFSINVPTLPSRPKEASSRWCIAALRPVWDTIRPSGPLPIGCVG